MEGSKASLVKRCMDLLGDEVPRGSKGIAKDFLRRQELATLEGWCRDHEALLEQVKARLKVGSASNKQKGTGTNSKTKSKPPSSDGERERYAKTVAHWVCRLKDKEEEVICAQLVKPDVPTEVLRTLATAVERVEIDLTVKYPFI